MDGSYAPSFDIQLPPSPKHGVGKDPEKRVLMLQFGYMLEKIAFLKKSAALRDLMGPPIYMEEDLTKA